MSLINLNSASYTSGLQSIINSPNIPTFIWKITLTATTADYIAQPHNWTINFPLVGGVSVCTTLPNTYQITVGQDMDSITTANFLTNLTSTIHFGVFLNTTILLPHNDSMYLYITCYGGTFSQSSGATTFNLN